MGTSWGRRIRRAVLVGVVASASTTSVGLGLGHVAAAPAPPVSASTGLIVRDVVYDRLRDVVYASVDETDRTHPNRVVTIDPETRAVIGSVSLGAIPSEMAITDDGSALFVGIDGRGELVKVSLPDFSVEWAHVMGPYHIWNTVVGDVAAVPGSTDVAAVSRRLLDISPEHAGIAIVDTNGVRRDITAGHSGSDSIVFDHTGVRVFGSDLGSTGRYFFEHEVGADGVVTKETYNFIGGGTLAYRNGAVLQSNGTVIDVTGSTPRVADTVIGGRSIAVDEEAGVFYIGSVNFGRGLRAYDLDTRELVDEWTLAAQTGSASELTLLGSGSLAVIDRSHPASRFGRLLFVELDEGRAQPVTPNPLTPVVPTPPDEEDLGSLGEYTPLTPQRVLDTRSGLGRRGVRGPLVAGERFDVAVTGVAGVPSSGVDAVVMNVTAVDATANSHLTIWPSGIERPTISSVNVPAAGTVANLVTMPVGADGSVSVFNAAGQVDVLFDIAGYYSSFDGPDGLRFQAVSPQRVLDTRTSAGGGPLGPGAARVLNLTFPGPVPSAAGAVVLNVTVTDTTASSYLSVFPYDVGRPEVSNLNFGAGATRANQVVVRLPAGGNIQLYNHQGSTQVVVDVVGYFHDFEFGESGRYIAVEPYRSLDTRLESPWPAPGHLPAGATLQLIDDSVEVSAFVMNVTVTDTTGTGYVTAYPAGPVPTAAPLASTLNYTAGATVPNHAIVRAAPDVAFFNSGGRVQLIVDVFGVFI